MLILVSALLLWSAFPPLNLSVFSWLGLVPFLWALEGISIRRVFGRGILFGFLFFVSTLWWIGYVTVAGMLVLSCYLSLFWGAFAVFYRHSLYWPVASRVFLVPAWYVVLEFVRERAFTGFGWSSLGHTQANCLGLIQISDITGVAGVSFVLVMVNVFLKECLSGFNAVRRVGISVLIVLLFVSGYGIWSFSRVKVQPQIKVAVIQGNISLAQAWNGKEKSRIIDKYLVLSRMALMEKPDLVLWPETAFPSFIWEEAGLYSEVRDFFTQHHVPFVFGAVTRESEKYFNSALFLDGVSSIAGVYSKRHLVVLGEYLPFRSLLGSLASMVPIDDFSPGDEAGIFSLVNGTRFSALICFEDTLSWLARDGVLKGGSFLVNITNDAWFRSSPGPAMHLNNAVFRAVENRRALVRAANTGLSCLINPLGVVGPCVGQEGQRLEVSGIAVGAVSLEDSWTFYTKHGDVFTFVCFISIIAGVGFLFFQKVGLIRKESVCPGQERF